MEITREQITELFTKAAGEQDYETIRVCTRALAGHDDAKEECAKILREGPDRG